MKYIIEITLGDMISRFEVEAKNVTRFELSDYPTIEEQLDYMVCDYYGELVDKFELTPKGQFEAPYIVWECFASSIKEEIYKSDFIYGKVKLIDSDVVLKEYELDLKAFLLQYLDNEGMCEVRDQRVACWVESSVNRFAELSEWHFALKAGDGRILCDVSKWPPPNGKEGWSFENNWFEPIIWFGMNDKDIYPVWSISNKDYSGDLSDNADIGRWFVEDSWYIWESVVDDADECFLIWATAECGCCPPDLSSIIERCPICISEDETNETLKAKVNEFFVQQWSDWWLNQDEGVAGRCVDICCCSDKTDVSIGLGVSLEPSEEKVFDLDADSVEATLGESFWENAFEFEEGVDNARLLIETGERSSVREALEMVFGQFDIVFSVPLGGDEFDLDIDLDVNEIMYSMLECMI